MMSVMHIFIRITPITRQKPDILVSGRCVESLLTCCAENLLSHQHEFGKNVREAHYEGISCILFDVWARI